MLFGLGVPLPLPLPLAVAVRLWGEMIGGVGELSIRVERDHGGAAGCSVVRLAGEADVTVTALGTVLRAEAAARPRLLAVDLSAVSFIDSAALRVIVGVYREMKGAGMVLALVRPSGPVARVLELTGLGSVIPVVGSVDEAAVLLEGGGAR